MDLWNDDIKFFMQIKWNIRIQKLCHNNIKIKIEK
jgi:hypothetical protein